MQLNASGSHADEGYHDAQVSDGGTTFCQHADQLSFFPGTPLEAIAMGGGSIDEFRPDIFA